MTSNPVTRTADHHVLIIGAYGLIGYGITKRLVANGYRVTGLGRSPQTTRRVLPDLNWLYDDLTTQTKPGDWTKSLDNITAVVNCSGALQDGPNDDLEALHHHAVAALTSACATENIKLVQISAVGAKLTASTPFLSSKARGDAAIRVSGARFYIFRPGLVIAPHAYGGTAMLRMLAAVPVLQPIALPEARIQTVSLSDVSEAVRAALDGRIPDGLECDLVG